MQQGVFHLRFPVEGNELKNLRAGDRVLISGTLYTARDRAHARMAQALRHGGEPPFDIEGQLIFYAGPCPPPPGAVIGSVGPTTSSRMDEYTPELLERGLAATMGKGRRGPQVMKAMVDRGAVYFLAMGGVAALLSTKVKNASLVAYEDLGPEAVYKLVVEDFPAIVGVDSLGQDVYALRKLRQSGGKQ